MTWKQSVFVGDEAGFAMRLAMAPSAAAKRFAIDQPTAWFSIIAASPAPTAAARSRASAGASSMGGRIRRAPDFDSWSRRGKQVTDLAERLGWQHTELWDWFWQFTLLAQHELRVDREIAEDSAWRLLRGCFDKLEVANETDGWCM